MAAFTLLQGLALNYLKIAGHVVRGLVRDPVSRILALALNQVGLREIGVDFVQGFCVGRPEPFEAALGRLADLRPTP